MQVVSSSGGWARFWGGGAGGAGGAPAQTPAELAADAAVAAAARRDLDARITLSGEVKDDGGRLLQDVEVRIYTVVFDPGAPGASRTESRKERVDGYFRFTCEPCAELRATFFAPGHHSAELGADYSEKSGAEALVEKLHRQVLLRRAGALPQLERFAGRLVVAEGEEEQVLPLAVPASGGPAPLSALPAAALPKSAGGVPGLPMVRLEVARRAGGSSTQGSSTQEIATHEIAGKAAVVAPDRPRLDFGEGGVVRAPAERDFRAQSLAMREAPAEGYSRFLELEAGSGEIVYFYCRVGGLYGRGSVTPAVVEETRGGRRVVAHVEIRLNPDGSRNLEAIE